MQTHVDLAFADGTYRCALPAGQIRELQDKCKVGIGGLFARVLQGRVTDDITVGHPAFAAYYLDDVVETVRHGLIGGAQAWVNDQEVKVGPLRANTLVERYLLVMPLMRQWDMAAAILSAAIVGYDGPEVQAEKKSPPMPEGEQTVG